MMADEKDRNDVGEVMSYLRALSAMSAGVKFLHHARGNIAAGTEPIELRIGVNSALVAFDAMRDLFISKGIASAEEIDAALALAATREVRRLEKEIKEQTGKEIKLDSLLYS
jgi:hypothetical protein